MPRAAEAEPAVETLRGESAHVAFLLIGHLVLRGLVAGVLPLFEAESYYWLWSQQLDTGYVDHPPGIALVLWLTTALGGLTPLAARAGPLLLGTLSAFLFHRWCRGLLGPRVAWRCLAIFCVAPFAMPFGIAALPDAPLHALWVACLATFTWAQRKNTTGAWLLLGLLTGLCILCKYNGWLLFGVYGLVLVLSAEGRARLASFRPWLGMALTLVVVAPNLLWNSDHGGATLATPLREGVDVGAALSNLGKFCALPLVLLTPVLGVAFFWRVVSGLRAGRLADPTFRLLACASVAPLGVFAGVSLLTEIHVHWPATALIAAVPLTLAPGPGPSERVLHWGAVIAAVCLAIIVLVPVGALNLPFDDPPEAVARMRGEFLGQQPIAERLQREVAALDDGRLLLMARDYHLTGLVQWMTGGTVPGLPLMRRRFRQYEVWYDDGDYAGWSALVLVKASDKRRDQQMPQTLQQAFDKVTAMEPTVVTVAGTEVRRWELFLCRGFRGPL